MAEEQVKVLRAIYADWAEGDFSDLDWVTLEFEFAYSQEFPDTATYTGRDGIITAWTGWLSEWRDVRIVPEEFVEGPDGVVVDVRVCGSGVEMAEPGANVWRFRERRPTRIATGGSPASRSSSTRKRRLAQSANEWRARRVTHTVAQ